MEGAISPEEAEELAALAAAIEYGEEPDPDAYRRTFAGTPLPEPEGLRSDPDFTLRFWSKVLCGTRRGDCWTWRARRKERGYGQFRVVTIMQAHRVAFMLWWGRWPDPERDLCHSCDNPACVNPAHLSESTRYDNMQQQRMRGRWRNQYGAGSGYPPPPTFIEPAAEDRQAVAA